MNKMRVNRRFLYRLFIALDACFRLKRRLIGNDRTDPGLGTGFTYFVEWNPYRNFILTVTDQHEVRSRLFDVLRVRF